MSSRRVHCRPPATLRFGSLSRLLESLPNAEELGARPLKVELSELRWIEALPIAVLSAFMLAHLKRPGVARTNSVIHLPQEYAFLERMDFFKTVAPDCRKRASSNATTPAAGSFRLLE